jgi:hypothetical protein
MIKTGVGYPAGCPGQTLVNASLENSATGATVYTVTAGKTLYVAGITISTGIASGSCLVKLTVSGTTKYLVTLDKSVGNAGGSMTPIFTVPASTALVLSHNSGGSDVCVTVWGWEQ